MNGKIKTKFAALFAVALMITVCVVPVVGNEGTDAAPVSPSNGEVFEGYELKLFTEGMDNYDDLVYYGTVEDAGVNAVNYNFIEIGTVDSKDVGYLVSKETGLFLRYGDIPNYTVWFDLPIVQFTYVYSQADINKVVGEIVVKQGTSEVGEFKFEKKTNFIDNTDKDPRNEGIVTFGLYDNLGSDHLEIAEAQAVGNFDVEITATQGVTQQVIKQTINAGPAVTVSGQITDADGNGIKGTITPVVEGKTLASLTVKEDGKYSFNVVPGSVVSVTAVATGYTFKTNEDTWNFGEVNASVSKTFKAVEKTGTITVTDADGNPLKDKKVQLGWYTQVAVTTTNPTTNQTTTKYTLGVMSNNVTGVTFNSGYKGGSVTENITTNDKGVAYFAYTLPEATVEKYNSSGNTTYSDYAYALVAKGINESGKEYTFDVATSLTGPNFEMGLQSLIASKTGMADAQYGSATIKAIEKTGTITVQSANGNPIGGETVTLAWNYQVAKSVTSVTNNISTTNTTYVIAAMPENASGLSTYLTFNNDYAKPYVTTTTTTDDSGKATFAYVLPKGTVKEYKSDETTKTSYSNYSYALVATGDNVAPYSFDSGLSSNVTSDLQTQINAKAGMADAQYGSATIKAEETTYKISGTVEGYSAKSVAKNIVSYKLSTSTTSVNVDLQKDGTFAFYVTEGNVLSEVKISTVNGSGQNAPKVFDASLYAVDSVSIGTIYQDVVVDFKLKPVDAPEAPVEYQVAIMSGEKVAFSYSIDGVKYTANLKSENNIAKLSFTAKIGAVIEISATAENYDISAFDGYKASAVKMTTRYVQVQADGEPVPGATFKVLYTYGTEKLSMDLTADDKGFANFTIPADSTEIKIAKGTQVKNLPSSTETDYDSGITYSVVTLDVYKAETSKVAIMYSSAYNSDTVLTQPVFEQEIAPGKIVTADVGDSIALKAPKIDNFEFVAWMVDGVVVSEKADYTLVVPAHDHDLNEPCEAVALYSAVHYEEPAEGLSMNVLVIGIVILILGILAVAYGIISKKQ